MRAARFAAEDHDFNYAPFEVAQVKANWQQNKDIKPRSVNCTEHLYNYEETKNNFDNAYNKQKERLEEQIEKQKEEFASKVKAEKE